MIIIVSSFALLNDPSDVPLWSSMLDFNCTERQVLVAPEPAPGRPSSSSLLSALSIFHWEYPSEQALKRGAVTGYASCTASVRGLNVFHMGMFLPPFQGKGAVEAKSPYWCWAGPRQAGNNRSGTNPADARIFGAQHRWPAGPQRAALAYINRGWMLPFVWVESRTDAFHPGTERLQKR